MTVVDIDAVRDWLGRLPGGSVARQYADDWDTFAKLDKPVVTLFGSYDTGKSSLLRRLLVDAGKDVPGWLTISARHETFEVNDVEIGGCLVRDTPGFAVGASDIRAQNNSRAAMAAVGLTDIGIAVLTSQLATAERDMLQELFGRGWPSGTMWFVISRFDEAGADPEGDPDGYRQLRDRKIRELRDVFALNDRSPVHVVSQDPFQTAGPDTDLYPEIWDGFRDWDGMRDLAEAFEAVSPAELPGWRTAAAQRYWTAVLTDTVTELRSRLADYTAQAGVAADGVARRTAWEKDLDALDRAAQAALDGLVGEVARRSGDTADFQAELQRALDTWFAKHETHLQRLRRSITKAGERDRTRPAWAGFASLVTALGNTDDAPQSPDEAAGVAGHVGRVGTMLLGVLKEATEVTARKAAKKSRAATVAGSVGRYLGTAEVALPIAVYVAELIDVHRKDRARLAADSAAAEELRRAIDECTERVREAWQPFVDDVRDEILAETAEQVDLDASLRDLVERLHEAVAEGEVLLQASTESAA